MGISFGTSAKSVRVAWLSSGAAGSTRAIRLDFELTR